MQLEEIASVINGDLKGVDVAVSGFSIDTRTLTKGQCYVAILGERLNGHDFIEEAQSKGASALIVSQKGNYALPHIIVDDTTEALGALALHHRMMFSLPTVALTGSCGKTTVKEMIASILPSPSFATRGNLNNHIGVPLSLLSLNKQHRYAVFELGANHIGEIKRTVNWVKPEVALITNVQPAHLDGFGSIEGVAQAKSEIFSSLKETGTAIINIDDNRIREKAARLSQSILSVSLKDKTSDCYPLGMKQQTSGAYHFTLVIKDQKTPIKLNVPGKHNVMNAVMAGAVCYALGIDLSDIQAGLEAFSGVPGRMAEKKGMNGSAIIDDTYNANVSSVKAAIEVLGHREGNRILVLGELAEVTSERDSHYAAIAKHAAKHRIELLLTCGKLNAQMFKAFENEQRHFQDKSDLLQEIKSRLTEKTTVLVKGSRSAKMEEIVEALSVNE